MKNKPMGMKAGCLGGVCAKCRGSMVLVFGIVLLINQLWKFADWVTLVAILLILAGILKLIKPGCGHCN